MFRLGYGSDQGSANKATTFQRLCT